MAFDLIDPTYAIHQECDMQLIVYGLQLWIAVISRYRKDHIHVVDSSFCHYGTSREQQANSISDWVSLKAEGPFALKQSNGSMDPAVKNLSLLDFASIQAPSHHRLPSRSPIAHLPPHFFDPVLSANRSVRPISSRPYACLRRLHSEAILHHA